MLAYNDNELARYTLHRVTVQVADVGIAALLVGRVNSTAVVWKCTHSGTVFSTDKDSAGFLSVSFFACAEGTFTFHSGSSELSSRSCLPCPFGGLGVVCVLVFWCFCVCLCVCDSS